MITRYVLLVAIFFAAGYGVVALALRRSGYVMTAFTVCLVLSLALLANVARGDAR